MTFAFLLTGEYRTFEYCFPSIKKYVLDVYRPDTYLCLPVGQSDRICELYNPVGSYFVSEDENREAVGDAEERFTNKANEAVVAANVSLYWKWKKCYELMGDKRYNVVFMARPDILIKDFAYYFSTQLSEDTIYLPRKDALGTVWTNEHEFYGGWGGQLTFGRQNVAQIASRMYDHLDEIYATYDEHPHQYGSWHTERNFKRWMHVMNHIDMELFDIDFQILR